MKIFFKTESEAMNYIKDKTFGFQSISPKVLFTLSEEIIDQEHFSFYDEKTDTRHHISLLKKINNFEVDHTDQKMSRLVFACEIGDIDLFNKNISNSNSEKAIALAFKTAIYNDQIKIVELFIFKDYIANVNLFENPIMTATVFDSINSFVLLLSKYELPSNILAHVLRHNSKNILNYIFNNKSWKEAILIKEFQDTEWVQKLLSKQEHNNETIEIYKKYCDTENKL